MPTSEPWMGHVDPNDHGTTGGRAWCLTCTEWCYPEEWCEHCKRAEFGDPWDTIDTLAAEVEVLRAIRVSQIEDIIALRYDLEVARESRATITALRAQVQRVREMHTIDQCPRCAEFHCIECGCEGVYTEQVSCRTTRVLDGGDR